MSKGRAELVGECGKLLHESNSFRLTYPLKEQSAGKLADEFIMQLVRCNYTASNEFT
jgi:hypothetical protein